MLIVLANFLIVCVLISGILNKTYFSTHNVAADVKYKAKWKTCLHLLTHLTCFVTRMLIELELLSLCNYYELCDLLFSISGIIKKLFINLILKVNVNSTLFILLLLFELKNDVLTIFMFLQCLMQKSTCKYFLNIYLLLKCYNK